MIVAHLDWESRSAADLKKVGVYVYGEDETTDIICASYAIGDEPPKRWRPGQDSRDIRHALEQSDEIHAFNAQFERVIGNYVATKRYGFKPFPIEKMRCVMVQGLSMGLPGSLENMSAALGIEQRKDMAGHRLMMKMCKPRRPGKHEAPGLFWHESEEEIERLCEYCDSDIEAERAVEKRLLPLSQSELELWFLDQKINDKGVFIDAPLARAATSIVVTIADRLNKRMFKVSNGEVRGVTDVAGLMRFCKSKNLPDIDSLAKDQLQILLAREDLADDVRECLDIRKEGAKASVAKIQALIAGRNKDGRGRGFLQFYAANTGRWAGRRFQPQNLKRPEDKKGVERAIETILEGNADMVELVHGPALSVIGDTIRGMVRAAPGNELTAADYSNIEGRVLAWLAGENWKLEAFRAFDAGTGPDLYKLAYARTFGLKVEDVTEDQRLVGKVEELQLGYQGGPGAFQVMAKNYGIEIGKSYGLMRDLAPEVGEDCEEAYVYRGRASGMKRETWVAAEIVKVLWREANPAIEQFWSDAERAAIMAVEQPGAIVTCGRIKFKKSGSFLFMRLPSGRAMAYPYPLVMDVPYFGKTKQALTYKTVPDPLKPGKIISEPDGSINMRWARISTYGGMLVENATQAVARDILGAGMKALDAAGYPLVLHVHDEPVSEHPRGFGSEEEFRSLMTTLGPCYVGLPIAAGSFRAARYRK